MQITAPEVFYWKSKAKDSEVDFVIYLDNKIIGLEVKSSEEITFGNTRQMREFLKSHSEVSRGIIVYNGHRVYPIASNIYAVPWSEF